MVFTSFCSYLVLLLDLEHLVDREYLLEKNFIKKVRRRIYHTNRLDLGYPFHHVHLEVLHLVDPYHPLDLDYLVDLVDLDNQHHPERRKNNILFRE